MTKIPDELLYSRIFKYRGYRIGKLRIPEYQHYFGMVNYRILDNVDLLQPARYGKQIRDQIDNHLYWKTQCQT